MKLMQLKEHIAPAILKRGEEYRNQGHIISLEETGNGVYHAEVEGTEVYEVEIRLGSRGEVVYSDCDCPYDLEDICKHQAAVLLELRDLITDGPSKHKQKEPSSLDDQLATLKKEQLIELLLTYARDYEEVNQRLSLHFANSGGKEELTQLVKTIRMYIKQSSERHGFVPYRNVPHAVTGAEMVLEKAFLSAGKGNTLHAVKICFCVVHEMERLLQSCDDSAGIVGGLVQESLDLVENAVQSAESISVKDKQALFRLLLKEAQYSGFEGWDEWQLSVLGSAAHLIDNDQAREEWENCVAKLEETVETDEWFGSYFAKHAALLRYRLIQQFDGAERAADFMKKNLEHTEFRELAISDAIASERYAEAIRLAEEGEAQDGRRGLPGLVHRWQKHRYELYKLTNQKEHQRRLGEQLLVDGEYAYYQPLKQLYSPEEWHDVYSRILNELEKARSWNAAALYTKLLIEEKETQRLLEYVRKNPSTIVEYYPYLTGDFPDEVYALFRTYIEQAALSASNRKEYQKLCKLIRELMKAGGGNTAKEIVQQLRERYPNRPAMLDELGKIKL